MLERIIADKQREVAEAREKTPDRDLLRRIPEVTLPRFAEALERPGLNVIAEVKYRSPSRGKFSCTLPPEDVAVGYAKNGAAAISVLTDRKYFDGELEYLLRVRQALNRGAGEDPGTPVLPLLRKDFIVDRYQVLEARVHEASAFLLIVAALDARSLSDLLAFGRELELDALVEVHDAFELELALGAGARLVGVNNRNLRNFEVSLAVSFEIARILEGEAGFTLVSESGISGSAEIRELQDAGFKAFLIGSHFMDGDNPGDRLAALMGSAQ